MKLFFIIIIFFLWIKSLWTNMELKHYNQQDRILKSVCMAAVFYFASLLNSRYLLFKKVMLCADFTQYEFFFVENNKCKYLTWIRRRVQWSPFFSILNHHQHKYLRILKQADKHKIKIEKVIHFIFYI